MDFDKKSNEKENEEKNEEIKKEQIGLKEEIHSKDLYDQIPEDVLNEFSDELSEPSMGLIARIVTLFTSPKEVMEDVKIKSYTGIMLVIFAIIGLLTTLPMLSIIKDAMLNAMIEEAGSGNIDSAMLDNILNYTMIFTVIAASLGSAFAPLVSGLVSHVVAILSGGEGKFKQTIGINVMAYTVVMAGAILRVALVLVTKNMYASFSPAMFLGSNPTINPYYGILSVFELFNLAYLYFVYLGIKVVHNVSNFKAWLITLIPTVILVIISMIPVLLK